MWSFISRLVLKLAAVRWLFKLGGLALLVPIAFFLKVVGFPILLIVGLFAIPVLILLFLFGLPIFLVLIGGGLFMGLLAMVVTIGIAALKIGLFVVLPAYLIWKVFCWIFRRGNGGNDETPPPMTPPPATDGPSEL
jgi:hypothetical protein